MNTITAPLLFNNIHFYKNTFIIINKQLSLHSNQNSTTHSIPSDYKLLTARAPSFITAGALRFITAGVPVKEHYPSLLTAGAISLFTARAPSLLTVEEPSLIIEGAQLCQGFCITSGPVAIRGC